MRFVDVGQVSKSDVNEANILRHANDWFLFMNLGVEASVEVERCFSGSSEDEQRLSDHLSNPSNHQTPKSLRSPSTTSQQKPKTSE
jgi:hypothetical protein